MDFDVVHPPRPEQQRVRRVGAAEEAVAAPLDHQAQVVSAREADGGDDVSHVFGGDRIGARRRAPGIQPARPFREARLVGEVERVAEQRFGVWTGEIG